MMPASNYDVVVVGAGAAGLTAAIGLARAGLAVAVVEAAPFPGAENWSGCVYFAENLAHPDILGPDGVEALAWERRLVERGFFATDGHGLLGMTYRDAAAFRHCYTVLRPIYDHHLAQAALRLGVALLCRTTAESLIREAGRVVGVSTSRGPLYAELIFLAEGDASHLVTREGYERTSDRRNAPHFLQGIKLVLELPPGAIEERFGIGPEEGVAYEMLVRNGTLRGRPVHLNMGGFLYANRQSLSVGLVLPADHLAEHFEGDPNLLAEWFTGLPALRPWLDGGRRGTFGAKLIRGGGAKDIPTLIDDGLAVGGAASGIGIDFPYPNFTGPATGMGLLLVQAVRRIRAEGGRFTREELQRHYLAPLQRTHYWQDVEFLRHWPGYVKKTQAFFGRDLDLALGSAYLWTRSNRWLLTRWTSWLRMVLHVASPPHWPAMQADARHLGRALRLESVLLRPTLGKLLLDGALNAARDLLRRPRANLPPAGTVRLHYRVAGGAEPGGLPPRTLRRWFGRFAPVLASAARLIYSNDDVPLALKLPRAVQLLVKQVNVFDLLTGLFLGTAAAASGSLLNSWDRLRRRLRGKTGTETNGDENGAVKGLYGKYAQAARRAGDLTPALSPAAQAWEARLAQLSYESVKASHIHVLWPKALQDKNDVVGAGLWHVCPAHVYEARTDPGGQVQVVVNFENCIKCETCWRTSDLVDWGRDGEHRFVYAVSSPVVPTLLTDMNAVGLASPTPPRAADGWAASAQELEKRLSAKAALTAAQAAEVAELRALLEALDRKLSEFDVALAEEPRTVDRGRAEYLEMLARYALQLAARVLEVLRGGVLRGGGPALAAAYGHLLTLATAAAAKAEERARHAWDQRFSWAAGDGRQIRQHHLAGLLRILNVLSPASAGRKRPDSDHQGAYAPCSPEVRWLRTEDEAASLADTAETWRQRLDTIFPPAVWRDLEHGTPLTAEQDRTLLDLLAQVPSVNEADLAATLHHPLRKWLLAELGRRDPSLAYRAASHLWARDLADAGVGLSREAAWCAFAPLAENPTGPAAEAEAFYVPGRDARRFLLLRGNQMASAGPDDLRVEPLATLGLRGAGMVRLSLSSAAAALTWATVDSERARRLWSVLSAADLVSIAYGMTDLLCRRAVEHATSRVQFPGLFHDEEARDPIGKFGAVKKMVAEIAARRYLLETLDHNLSPAGLGPEDVRRAGLVKALAAEALGTAPGSVSYNAGQVFGGTGYSEDDLLSKFYRDAAAWRFLGPDNVQVFLDQGETLLTGWEGEGQRLSGLTGEAELFDQLAQRKALQAELDEVRVHRSRVRSLVGDWRTAHAPGTDAPGSPAARAELCEALGRQDAILLASKALLLRTHARLEQGLPSETELSLVRVWLESAAAALGEFEGSVRRQLDRAGRRDDRPVVDPSAGPPVTSYAEFLASPSPYDSGDFLLKPADLTQPRFVPEMIDADPDLAARKREFRDFFKAQFGAPRDGLVYERYIEREHRPDAADLDFLRRLGYFRMPIPRELGGEGRPKVDYYLLTTTANRLADVAVSLTIQVSSSLGTTPVLLARDKDLPKAQKDLGPFVGDPAVQQEVRERLQKLLSLSKTTDLRGLTQAAAEFQQRLAETVESRTVLRGLAGPFLQACRQAGRAIAQREAEAAQAPLQAALAAWPEVCTQAAELHDELGRRREASDVFLRWVASGQISGFALTEPSAGSDTARVATRARLRSAPVEAEPDGALRFVPAGGKGPRYLLDARRLEFRTAAVDGRPELRAFYRWSDTAEPSLIHFDEYDYETDDPQRFRYYDHGDRRVHFTDIAQLRKRDGKLWYDYWELSGAKMWITNGRMCGVLCLYAKTDAGVTGFMVDRHAEGLVVGKDEAKMGQCGSPTNELSLQAVRVPRENVIGLEGRGQVNALETLNVGRAGLAMSAMSQMRRLVEWSNEFAGPPWVAWRLQRMEEERFIAEALAHFVVGRFEHKQTRSIRLESAIAKMLASELLQHIIETAEEIHGLAGQTELHLVEKRKRDARVLNIYEGTNEIQRFFILKDVASEVAPRWTKGQPAAAPGYLSREAVELDALKANVRQRAQAALDVFGQQLWQNPNLQANCFLLSEAVAWLAAADSTLGRLAWLSRQARPDENAEPPPQVELGRRALARCASEVRDRLKRFDEELTDLRRGSYAPEIRAASLLFRQAAQPQPVEPPASKITRPLSVLVVLEPPAPGVPDIHVADGRLLEAYRVFSDADRSALEEALRLRDAAGERCRVRVATVGPPATGQLLREVVSLGVEPLLLLVPHGRESVPADRAAAALAAVLKDDGRFDLVLGGGGGAGEEGVLARLTAEALGHPFAGTASRLAVRAGQEDALQLLTAEGRRTRPLPAGAAVEAGLALRPFTVAGYLEGLGRTLRVEPWPAALEAEPVTFAAGVVKSDAAPAETRPEALQPWQASAVVLEAAGLGKGHAARAGKSPGADRITIAEAPRPPFDGADANCHVLALLATDANGDIGPSAEGTLRAAQLVALAAQPAAALSALVLTAKDRQAQQRTAAALAALGPFQVVLVPMDVETSDEVRGRLLVELWSHLRKSPAAVVGEPWTEAAFAVLGGRSLQRDRVLARVLGVDRRGGKLEAETGRLGGRVRCRQALSLRPGATCWLSVSADVQVGAISPPDGESFRAVRWAPPLERFYGRDDVRRLLEELKQQAGLVRLSDAEFIIDVGFGVGNRDGYEAVIDPLEQALRQLGARGLMIGGSRKVTEELHLLPADRQIGQSGVSVNPRVLLAIGVSGAPQHLSYIGPRATIVAFNSDPEAPIMTLNQRQPQPRVFPVVGDLFETVPAFVAALKEEPASEPSWPHPEITDGV
jgi:electron transfer flavoprotein-quinone oxidoreductase